MKRILIAIIKFYRKYISPMKSTKCPYYPTCSQYGLEAVEKYGAFKGGMLAAWRILRSGFILAESFENFCCLIVRGSIIRYTIMVNRIIAKPMLGIPIKSSTLKIPLCIRLFIVCLLM